VLFEDLARWDDKKVLGFMEARDCLRIGVPVGPAIDSTLIESREIDTADQVMGIGVLGMIFEKAFGFFDERLVIIFPYRNGNSACFDSWAIGKGQDKDRQ